MQTQTQFHKLIVWLLTAVMLMTLIPMAAFAKEDLTDSTTAITLKDTDDDGYYEISTADELVAFANLANDGNDSINIELTKDIDMTGKKWSTVVFGGNIDGNGHSISNLEMVESDMGSYVAGFIYSVKATVKNLYFINCSAIIPSSVSTEDDCYAGIIAAAAEGLTVENCSAINCTVKQEGTAKNMSYAGGLLGGANGPISFDYCSFQGGSVSTSSSDYINYAGGLVAGVWDYGDGIGVSITNSFCSGDVTATREGYSSAGGIIGLDQNEEGTEPHIYKNCYFSGNIKGLGYAAGLSGDFCATAEISNFAVLSESIDSPYTDPFIIGHIKVIDSENLYIGDFTEFELAAPKDQESWLSGLEGTKITKAEASVYQISNFKSNLYGTLEDKSKDITIALYQGENEKYTAVTDADGKYHFGKQVLPGEYTLKISEGGGYKAYETSVTIDYATNKELDISRTASIHTVTFDANGGSVTPANAETVDGKLTELPTPTRTGYTFNGWFDAQTGGNAVTTDKVYTENTTIYAQWQRDTSVQLPIYIDGTDGNDENDGLTDETPVKTLAKALELAGTNGTIIVMKAVWLSSDHTIENITIERYENNTTGDLFSVAGNANDITTITVKNATIDGKGITLDNTINTNEELFWLGAYASLVLEEGAKLVNNRSVAVYVATNAELIMNNGEISGNISPQGFAVVHVSGTFKMNGGSIKNNRNEFSFGGAVDVYDGTFIMTDGEISGNYACTGGGGVFGDGATLTILNGKIINNTVNNDATNRYGGGIYGCYDTTLNIYGGEISGNTCLNGDAISFMGNTNTTINVKGSPKISGTIDIGPASMSSAVQVIDIFTPVNPLIVNRWEATVGTAIATYADGLTADASKFKSYSASYSTKVDGVNVILANPAVTFDANGGTVTPASAETGTDGKLTELPTPARTGYKFNGWFDEQTGGTDVTTATVFGANTTIYAQWTEKATVSINETPQTYTYGNEEKAFEIKDTTLTDFTVKYFVDYEWTTDAPTDAGTYNVLITRYEDDTYKAFEKEITGGLVINPKDITGAEVGTFTAMTYTGSEQTPAATVTIDGLTVTGTWSKVTNVADKTTFTADGNFTGTIADKETGMTAADMSAGITASGYNGTYDGEGHTITVSLSGVAENATVKYGTTEGTYELDAAPSYTVSGLSTVYYQVTKENYETVTGSATVEIAKAKPTANSKKATTARVRKNNKLSAATVTNGEFFAVDGETVLEGTFSWVEPEKKISADGTEKMKFTPTDSNYAEIEIDVAVDSYSSDNTSTSSTRPITGIVSGITSSSNVDDTWENPFTDVLENDWFYENVEYIVENGLFNGTSATIFAPNGLITRAMMVTVLYRAEGEPDVTGEATFTDVDANAYYAKAVVWGQQNGIIRGYSETEFAPDQNIIREQIAAIMHRYAQYKGYDVSVGETTNILSYTDYDSITEYAIPSIQYAVSSGLMKGKTDTTINPQDNATRAEIAAILQRLLEAN